MKLNESQEVGLVVYFVVISEEMRYYHEPFVFHTKARNMRILGNEACLQFTHHDDAQEINSLISLALCQVCKSRLIKLMNYFG
jgi:hypothetical protein